MTISPPLLQLADGRKVRARKALVFRPRESRLHTDVADLLRNHALQDWRWTHISRKAKDAREGAILNEMGVQKGWPDFLLLSPFDNRQVHGLELKRHGESLTLEQDEWREWCLAHGGKYAVAWTMDDVLDAFYDWGCTRLQPLMLPK